MVLQELVQHVEEVVLDQCLDDEFVQVMLRTSRRKDVFKPLSYSGLEARLVEDCSYSNWRVEVSVTKRNGSGCR